MTNEEKDLLLKDLCARLPYGVKVLCLRDFNHEWYNLEMVDIGDNEVYVTAYEPYTNRYVKIEEVKPYLFPMSSMTEEQTEELIKLINTGQNDNNEFMRSLCRIEFYHVNHFDYRGLIPLGLAIDATDLNIY